MNTPSTSSSLNSSCDETCIAQAASLLSSSSRLERQNAASYLLNVAYQDPFLLKPYKSQIVLALNSPEPRTRRECFDILTQFVSVDSRGCDKAIDYAEYSLFDEVSGQARLSTMRFLCRIGCTTKLRSQKTWPLIDEAIQCFHGDLEFPEMMLALLDFSCGNLSDDVKEGLKNRMKFDAAHSPSIGKYARRIIENVS